LIINESGEDICLSVIVKTYGEVECITHPGVVIDEGTLIGAKSFESEA
jgi:hypothetical protein